jgi:hypothetical protein
MSLIALPLRFDRNGALRRLNDPDTAVVQLLEAMWRTPCDGGWYGSGGIRYARLHAERGNEAGRPA